MKKFFGLMTLSLLVFLIGLQSPLNAGDKKDSYVLSIKITKQLLEDVKVSKRKMGNGLRLEITSPNPKKIEFIKNVFLTCQTEAAVENAETTHPNELLYLKTLKYSVSDMSNGIKIEMTSDTPETVKIIKKVIIPRTIFRNVGEDITGEGEE